MMGIDNGFECVAHGNKDARAYRRLHNLEANAPYTTIGAQKCTFCDATQHCGHSPQFAMATKSLAACHLLLSL